MLLINNGKRAVRSMEKGRLIWLQWFLSVEKKEKREAEVTGHILSKH